MISTLTFQNFVRNSINVYDQGTLSQLWDAFNRVTEGSEVPSVVNGSQKSSDQSTDRTKKESTNSLQEHAETQTVEGQSTHVCIEKKKKKKSKKYSKKETDEKCSFKGDRADCNGAREHSMDSTTEHVAMETSEKKKKKKDKHRVGEDEMEPSLDSTSGKKKRKHAHSEKEEMPEMRTKKMKLCASV